MSSPIDLDEDNPAAIYAPRQRISHARRSPGLPAANRSGRDKRKLRTSHLQFSGDRAILELRRQLTLDPTLIPEPSPERRSSIGPILLRLCGVLGFAVIIAWGVVTYSVPNEALVAGDVVEAISAENAASPNPGEHAGWADAAGSQSIGTHSSEQFTSTPTPPPTEVTSQITAENATDSIAAPAASTTSISAAEVASPPVAQLDSDELEMLLKRGKEFLADGDLASARLLLRRAAEGGSAEAALVLGTTFDPLVIQRLGVLGAHPDIGKARQWYQRAAELGSNTASQRLARLAAAP